MIERIKELKLQAIKLVAESYSCDIEDFTDIFDERVRARVDEKFAELIIQECIDIADEYVRGDHGGIQGSPTAKSKIGIEIKKHFEVEERE